MQALSSAGDFVVPPRRAEIHPRMELQRNKTDKNSVGLLAQLALDYSPEEDAGLTLASLPTSFLGGLRKPDPSSATLSNVSLSSGLIALAACRRHSSACLRNLRASSSGRAFYDSTGRSQEQQKKLPSIYLKSARTFHDRPSAVESLAGATLRQRGHRSVSIQWSRSVIPRNMIPAARPFNPNWQPEHALGQFYGASCGFRSNSSAVRLLDHTAMHNQIRPLPNS